MTKENLDEQEKNIVKYELYTAKPPDDRLIQKYKKHVASLVSNRDFNLRAHKYLNLCHGSHQFNQSIEEEWLVVYLLFKLSEYDHDLVIKVHDNDGDILLIEAAEHLPSWLESSKSKNRVFVHDGKLHIIPEHINLNDLKQNQHSSSVAQSASQFIRDMNRSHYGHSIRYSLNKPYVKTKADPAIQDAIMKQLSGMPDKEKWLSKKYKQLDEIITDTVGQDANHLEKNFKTSLSLSDVMAMRDEDLLISPISSISSSVNSSSSWLTERGD